MRAHRWSALRPATAYQLHTVYLAKGVHATTSIEGNTLTEEQVRQQIEKTLKVPASQESLQQEVQNIIDACNEVTHELGRNPHVEITVERIKAFPVWSRPDARRPTA